MKSRVAVGLLAIGVLSVGLQEGCSSTPPARDESFMEMMDRLSHERSVAGGQGECPAEFVRVCTGSFHANGGMSCGCSFPDQVQSAFHPLYK